MGTQPRQVVSAVKHLHTGPRICHRDVKPENVVLSATGAGVAAKLIDFDTAMVFSDRVSCRATCGTFPFMAPEVAEKDRRLAQKHKQPRQNLVERTWRNVAQWLGVGQNRLAFGQLWAEIGQLWA